MSEVPLYPGVCVFVCVCVGGWVRERSPTTDRGTLVCVCVCVSVCVCVRVREVPNQRERERAREF